MKRYRKLLILALSIMSLVLLVLMVDTLKRSITNPWKVCTQANTKWVSEDGAVVFYVNDNLGATGSISIGAEVVDIYMTEGPLRSKEMHIYPIEVLENEIISEKDKYEYWICAYLSAEKFVATIVDSTFFNGGQQLIFYRDAGE